MEYYGKLSEARYSAITPRGYLKALLEKEKNGIPGHLDEIGYPFEFPYWAHRVREDKPAASWWPYEQTAYWIDSLVRCGSLLKDEELLNKVMPQIEASLADEDDPYIGPELAREKFDPSNRWPHAVYFRALYALYSFTGEKRYLERMRRHFTENEYDYTSMRNVVNVEMMLRVAAELDDAELKAGAIEIFDRFWENFEKKWIPYAPENLDNPEVRADGIQHGVTYNEILKLPAIVYLYTGERRYLEESVLAYRHIFRHHLMADGLHSCSEFLAGHRSTALHESCDVTDFTWALGYLLEATGDARYADAIERVMLNAFPGSIGPDYRTMQYFSAVNQVICKRDSSSAISYLYDPRQAFQPLHNPQCCSGNLGRALPNYLLRAVQETSDGAAVSFYGDYTFDGESLAFTVDGAYPFGDTVKIKVKVKDPAKNMLSLRLPGWSAHTVLTRNGEPVELGAAYGYFRLAVSDGDEISIRFTKRFESKQNGDNGVYFVYGPFTLALRLSEKWVKDPGESRQTEAFPAYALSTDSTWSYAVTGREKPEVALTEFGRKFLGDPSLNPFDEPVFSVRIQAKELRGVKLAKGVAKKKISWEGKVIPKKKLCYTPGLPSAQFIKKHLGDKKTVELVPYGNTELRVTVFPQYDPWCGALE